MTCNYILNRSQLETGAPVFINHLKKWGLHAHVAPTLHEKSKSTVMLCPSTIQHPIKIDEQGNILPLVRPENATEPLQVPNGYIRFVESYKFLGCIQTSDCKPTTEIRNRCNKFYAKLHLYKDCIKSRELSKSLRKTIIRVCLDEVLFYSSESLLLNAGNIKTYTSARLHALRALKSITRYDQHIYHINEKSILKEFKMATCLEKIMRRCFRFIGKIVMSTISQSPTPQRPEKMLMGYPLLKSIIDEDNQTELPFHARKPKFADTLQYYLTTRAFQMHHHVDVENKDTECDFDNIRFQKALLRYEGNQSDMNQDETWGDIIRNDEENFERLVIFGQFNNVDKNESLQLKRQRRQNTFAAQVPHSYIRGPHQHYGTGKTGLKLKLRDQ